MKIYEVEIKTTVIVLADNEDEAIENTKEDMREIKSDTDFFIEVIKEADKEALPDEWDEDCIPYGGDGNTRIKNIEF